MSPSPAAVEAIQARVVAVSKWERPDAEVLADLMGDTADNPDPPGLPDSPTRPSTRGPRTMANPLIARGLDLATAPPQGCFTVTPSDSADLTLNGSAIVTRAIRVDVAGYLKLKFLDDTIDEMYMAAGIWHSMLVKRVYATPVGAIATGIHAGY